MYSCTIITVQQSLAVQLTVQLAVQLTVHKCATLAVQLTVHKCATLAVIKELRIERKKLAHK